MIAFNATNIKNNDLITLSSLYSEKFLLIFYSESLKASLYLEIHLGKQILAWIDKQEASVSLEYPFLKALCQQQAPSQHINKPPRS